MTGMDTIRHPSFSKGHPRLQTTCIQRGVNLTATRAEVWLWLWLRGTATVLRRLARAAWADGGKPWMDAGRRRETGSRGLFLTNRKMRP